MVLYDHDSNASRPEPLKSCSNQELVQAYTTMHSQLTRRDLRPTFQNLYIEGPAGLKTFMKQEGVTFQLTRPNIHRTNASEHAIQKFKDRLVSDLRSWDPKFILCLWD